MLNGGKITEQEYEQWRLAQIGRGKRFEALRDDAAERLTHTNEIAVDYINENTPDIFAVNRNYMSYELEKQCGNIGFTLYDENTVKKLITEQTDLLPAPSINIPIDLRWNKQLITAEITSGILQGESLGKIATRIQNITDANRTSAIRNARTALTAAENAGRQDSFSSATKMGIKLEKQWLATLDGRTRHSHAMLDEIHIPNDEKFSNGCMFPGDPNGPPEEIYNCRCTLTAYLSDVDTSDAQRRARNPETGKSVLFEDMSYSEWAEWKEQEKQVEKSEHSAIMGISKSIFTSAKSKKEAESYLRDELGIAKVKTTGISLESMNAINSALTDSIQKYPQLAGMIQQVKVSKAKDTGVAAFGVSYKNGIVSTSLILGQNDLADINEIAEMIKQNVDAGYWTPKNGVDGIIQHEMGHALEFVQAFVEKGVEPFSTNVNDTIDKYMAIKDFSRGKVAERVVTQAVGNLGMRPAQWVNLSDYAATSYAEAFAEAISDSSNNPLSNEIKRIVNGGFK